MFSKTIGIHLTLTNLAYTSFQLTGVRITSVINLWYGIVSMIHIFPGCLMFRHCVTSHGFSSDIINPWPAGI